MCYKVEFHQSINLPDFYTYDSDAQLCYGNNFQ